MAECADMIIPKHWDVYIASSEEDDHLVEPLVQGIESYSFVCFRAHKDIIPGQNEIQAREFAMKEARKVLLYLTGNFLQDGWCEMERGVAMIKAYDKMENPSNEIVLIPVIKGLKTNEIPQTLKALRCIDVDKDGNYLEKIVAALKDPKYCWEKPPAHCPNCSQVRCRSSSALDLHLWFTCEETHVYCPTGHCATVLRRSKMKMHVQKQHQGEALEELYGNIYGTERLAKGKFQYEKQHTWELSFNVGDRFQIINYSPDHNWWLVKDLRDQRIGYAPQNYLEIEDHKVVPAVCYPHKPALPAPDSPNTKPALPAPDSSNPKPALPAPDSPNPKPALPAPDSPNPKPALPSPNSPNTKPALPAPDSPNPKPNPAADLCMTIKKPRIRSSMSWNDDPDLGAKNGDSLVSSSENDLLSASYPGGTRGSPTLSRQVSESLHLYQRQSSIAEEDMVAVECQEIPPPDFSVKILSCDRRQAKKMLKKRRKQGAYLLRHKNGSETDDNEVCCVLSVLSSVENDQWRPKHYEIKQTKENMYRISQNRIFRSLEQLVWFYKGHKDGLSCQLTEPLKEQE